MRRGCEAVEVIVELIVSRRFRRMSILVVIEFFELGVSGEGGADTEVSLVSRFCRRGLPVQSL